ncbi:MAG TPA: ABC transporter permease [Gaiellaceae bacterium]
MSAQPYAAPSRRSALAGELGKLPAFLRRDLLVMLSYRTSFVAGWLGLLVQALLFYFVGRLVDPSTLPSYGGHHAGYMEFVIIGMALGGFLQLALARVSAGIRNEQLMGTLESLLATPTSPNTVQLGTVFFDLVYIPIRTAFFILLVAVVFGLDLHASGVLPALLVLFAFLPFVWGIGVANAGLVLTFKRGTGVASFGALALTMLSGAFFPLALLPAWAAAVARLNPLAISIEAMREALLGGAGIHVALVAVLELLPFVVVSLAAGFWIFRLALRRERRLGTIGLY